MPEQNGKFELLEIQGFDLLGQVEATLRSVRQYQREVQRLRGTLTKGQTSTSDLPPIDAVEMHLKELRYTCGLFADSLRDIESTVAEIKADSNIS
jgi:hypothetical protein